MTDHEKHPVLADDYATQKEVAAAIGTCTRTLDRWRSLAKGPPITKLGRRVLYRRSSLAAWLVSEERANA